jgi:hypothetical protein
MPSPPPPPDISQFPDRARALGVPTHIYKLPGRVYRHERRIGLLQCAVGLVAVGLALNFALNAVWWAALVGVALATGMFFVGGYHLLTIYKERGITTLVARNGLVRIRGQHVTLIRWREIRLIVAEYRHHRIAHLYYIRLHDGRVYNYFDTTRDGRIGETIQYRHAVELLPRFVAEYDEGTPHHFGPVTIDREGIHTRQRLFAWREIHRYEFEDGVLRLYANHQWHTVARAGELENTMIMLGILKHAAERKYRPDTRRR